VIVESKWDPEAGHYWDWRIGWGCGWCSGDVPPGRRETGAGGGGLRNVPVVVVCGQGDLLPLAVLP